jgi:UDP-GlcNAc:undecaprenyl-phosphate GlcNAc-1-phosphate transferase
MLTGLYDDIKGISPRIKLIGQVVAAIVLVYGGFSLQFITNPFTGGIISLGIFSIPITIIWIVALSNAINLVDGLDGLSAGIAAIASLTLAVVCFSQDNMLAAGLAAILGASALGFLRYNFYPARTFMGDCGSLFLGFVLAALSLLGLSKGATIISIFIPLIIMGIPICDTLFAIIRRLFQHKPIFQADKEHLHHQLLGKGLNHRQTVLIIYAISLFMGICAIFMAILELTQAVAILILFFVTVFIGGEKLGVLRGNLKERAESKNAAKRKI